MEIEIVYLLWSNTHHMWWAPGADGYTNDIHKAGRYLESVAVGFVLRSALSGQLQKATCMVAAPENWGHIGLMTSPEKWTQP